MNDVIIIGAYLDSDFKIDICERTIKDLKKYNREIILSSHSYIPEKIQKLVDYTIIDIPNNKTNKDIGLSTITPNYWHRTCNDIFFIFDPYKSVNYSYGVYSMILNAVNLAQRLKKDFFHYVEFDILIEDDNYINKISDLLKNKKGYFRLNPSNFFEATFYSCDVNLFLDKMKNYTTEEFYNDMGYYEGFLKKQLGKEDIVIEPKDSVKYKELSRFLGNMYNIVRVDNTNHLCFVIFCEYNCNLKVRYKNKYHFNSDYNKGTRLWSVLEDDFEYLEIISNDIIEYSFIQKDIQEQILSNQEHYIKFVNDNIVLSGISWV